MSKKPLIVFEGIEGSGKSLHIKNVEKYLKKKKVKFIKFREPGGSKTSEKIRNLEELIIQSLRAFRRAWD